MTQIEKHEKAIKLLELIDQVEYRILTQERIAIDRSYFVSKWNNERLELNRSIKKRLENYYNLNFRL